MDIGVVNVILFNEGTANFLTSATKTELFMPGFLFCLTKTYLFWLHGNLITQLGVVANFRDVNMWTCEPVVWQI